MKRDSEQKIETQKILIASHQKYPWETGCWTISAHCYFAHIHTFCSVPTVVSRTPKPAVEEGLAWISSALWGLSPRLKKIKACNNQTQEKRVSFRFRFL